MKKSELKNIIKECVKEVIFEEGVLSGIISEVAQGLQGATIVQEARQPQQRPKSTQMSEAKKKVLSAIGGNGYDHLKNKFSNPELFEGTVPIQENTKGALGGISPGDSGVDISNMPGLGNWAAVASRTRK